MNKALAGFLVGVCAGGAIVYFAVKPAGFAKPRAAQTATAPPDTPAATDPGVVAAARAMAEPAAAPIPHPDAVASPSASSAGTSTGPQGSTLLELPGGRLDAAQSGDPAPLDKLLNSMSAYCAFDAGAGGQWPGGKVLAHGAAWQGGPLEFDAINLVDQTAQMTRNPWVAASAEGTPLRVTATRSGLHFSGFKPDGELIVVTAFGMLDSSGRHRAVVSLHGTRLDHESAQFYGWCTVR